MSQIDGTVLPDHEVVVIGAGFAGIGAAITLDRAGISDYLLVEEGAGVGGAWYWNDYPGISVDIPSFSYQFSFEQSADWSRVYAPGAELKTYAERCVERYGLRSRIRLETRVVAATFDEAACLWRLETASGGEITARFVIGATGPLSQPNWPELPGLERFAGATMHTARWDHDVDLSGKRVAVVGTGASAIQVIPSIAPIVDRLVVLQRTPIWCLPKPERTLGPIARALLRRLPGAQSLMRFLSQAFVELNFPVPAHFYGIVPVAKGAERIARKYLRTQVHDPATREQLTPQYGLGCKRPGFHNEYLATFNRKNVVLETAGIAEIGTNSLRTAAGAEHDVDVLVFATGFKVFEPGHISYPIHGVGGVDLQEWWETNRYQAYQGVSVPGFPNMFSIIGPYAFNGASYFHLIEAQMRHITRCLKHARQTESTHVEVTTEANARYFESMLARRHRQIFFQDTCSTANSYYVDNNGDVPLRASVSPEVDWRSTHFNLDDYRFERPSHGRPDAGDNQRRPTPVAS